MVDGQYLPVSELANVELKPEGTVSLMVEPRRDAAVVALGSEIIHINLYAQQLTVASDADMGRATNDLVLISGLKKAIEEKRKEYLAPLREHVEAINDFFKLLVAPLDVADKTVRGKMMTYRQAVEDKRRDEALINTLRMEAAQAEMRLKGELTEPVNLVEVSPPAPSKVQTDLGSVGTTKTWKFEIVDFSLLPEQYKLPDMVKIRKVVTAGATIPGVRAWQEDSLRVNAR